MIVKALNIIRQNKIYFTCLGLYFFVAGIMVWMQEKGTAVLFLNGKNHPALDVFFQLITYLGDGLFAIPLIVVILLFKSIFKGLVLLAGVLCSFFVVQGLKLYIFQDMPRPLKYFPESMNLYFVEGLDIHSYHSFPSGHSAQAFSLALLFTLFTANKNWSILFFGLALLVTVSRMYLAQHFLIDTYFGALLATVISFMTYYYFMNHTKLSENERLKKGWLL